MEENPVPKWKKTWDNSESNLVTDYDFILNIYSPRRSEMLSLFPHYANFIIGKPKILLDIGAGTGAAAFSVLEQHNDAKAVLIDGSMPMLQEAREKANGTGYDIEIICQDLTDSDWREKCRLNSEFPLIISNIMIHHLTDPEKKRFFSDIFTLLLPGGTFLYGDLVKMETEALEDIHYDFWVEEIIRNKQRHGREVLSFKEEKSNLIAANREQGDDPSTIKFVLESLKNAGFHKCGLIWFYIKFALFIAKKQI